MEYSKDGYSGVLTLDHTTLQTEAAGYTTKMCIRDRGKIIRPAYKYVGTHADYVPMAER